MLASERSEVRADTGILGKCGKQVSSCVEAVGATTCRRVEAHTHGKVGKRGRQQAGLPIFRGESRRRRIETAVVDREKKRRCERCRAAPAETKHGR